MSDRVCVITGVGWGTGSAIVQKFAASGYKVAMLARREDRLAKLENDIKSNQWYTLKLNDISSKLIRNSNDSEIIKDFDEFLKVKGLNGLNIKYLRKNLSNVVICSSLYYIVVHCSSV